MNRFTSRQAAMCDLMALAGRDRWKEWGNHMADNLSQNTEQARFEFRVMLDCLRLDVGRTLRDYRTRFAREANWETEFFKLVKMHLRSSWHLFAPTCLPLIALCGFHRAALSVPAHVAASYEGLDLRVISASQVA